VRFAVKALDIFVVCFVIAIRALATFQNLWIGPPACGDGTARRASGAVRG